MEDCKTECGVYTKIKENLLELKRARRARYNRVAELEKQIAEEDRISLFVRYAQVGPTINETMLIDRQRRTASELTEQIKARRVQLRSMDQKCTVERREKAPVQLIGAVAVRCGGE